MQQRGLGGTRGRQRQRRYCPVDEYSDGGTETEDPRRWLVIFWGVAQGAVASVLLWSGGDDLRAGLTALQNLVIIVGRLFMR